ncbi:hypothetical protein BU26DRAFT_334071 [Trematosphaeria pertusa]|uniref:Transcription factor Iwr1 domain-containing protein n=1 Tax=Trematosphaeria pertusa TaxID=390896 RepID=A0A6A6IFX9_9PLEO|nr:uncharacterized protein BU26DRAFT_334071 [Trematosphaeria pertusa]KAF2248433.1 hypothetical protein BU26DRAFT_334071 [Trematosphaeria pertusa]
MAPNPPQTLSVKRKRTEPPVDSIVVQEQDKKRLKSETYAWRLVQKAGPKTVPQALPSPALEAPRFLHYHSTTGNRVILEAKPRVDNQGVGASKEGQVPTLPEVKQPEPASQAETPRPRKRPGAGSALHHTRRAPAEKKVEQNGPSEDEVRQFEQFSEQVENDELKASKPPSSPLKYKPKVPALRYKDRHPDKAAALGIHDPDAMDVDEYVYDTYVREIVMPDADGKLPEPQGTVGYIVINEEDEEWWNGDDESDREFDTDDEDENAEDYYANDYPEDELSSDDEYDRNLYQKKYRHGSDNEDFNLDDEDDDAGARSDEDEDDEHFRRIAPPSRPGYWGRVGE